MTRPSVHRTLMDEAKVWAKRSTCSRANVGAVLSKGSHTIAVGYNGAPSGLPHCEHEKHPVAALDPHVTILAGVSHCNNAIHAEVNAVLNAAKRGQSTRGAALYCTHFPCAKCAGFLINAGIADVVFLKEYGDTAKAREMFKVACIEVRSLRQAERDAPNGVW
jgi:dCMP deaminase